MTGFYRTEYREKICDSYGGIAGRQRLCCMTLYSTAIYEFLEMAPKNTIFTLHTNMA
jgi:hypothetical protein